MRECSLHPAEGRLASALRPRFLSLTASGGPNGESQKPRTRMVRILQLVTLLLMLGLWWTSADAECSEKKVKRMSKEGNTIASIARTCNISKEDVQSILNDDDNEKEGTSGLPPGTPLAQCGCWGFVDPRSRQPQPECQSGYARPSPCSALCPGGGYAWRGVCTK
jgi:hypothetical protein